MLYIVATPIGNLEDITFRAVRILNDVDVIACEDTRHSRRLCQHYQIATPLVSYHEHNEKKRSQELLKRLLQGERVALISDAGWPGISDPGYHLIQAAITHDVPMTCLPGPSATLTALVLSGKRLDTFAFYGFLPHKKGRRTKLLETLLHQPMTSIVYESPYRVLTSLEAIATIHPDKNIVVCRELTKKFEDIRRGTALELIDHFRQHAPRGEFVFVL